MNSIRPSKPTAESIEIITRAESPLAPAFQRPGSFGAVLGCNCNASLVCLFFDLYDTDHNGVISLDEADFMIEETYGAAWESLAEARAAHDWLHGRESALLGSSELSVDEWSEFVSANLSAVAGVFRTRVVMQEKVTTALRFRKARGWWGRRGRDQASSNDRLSPHTTSSGHLSFNGGVPDGVSVYACRAQSRTKTGTRAASPGSARR